MNKILNLQRLPTGKTENSRMLMASNKSVSCSDYSTSGCN